MPEDIDAGPGPPLAQLRVPGTGRLPRSRPEHARPCFWQAHREKGTFYFSATTHRSPRTGVVDQKVECPLFLPTRVCQPPLCRRLDTRWRHDRSGGKESTPETVVRRTFSALRQWHEPQRGRRPQSVPKAMRSIVPVPLAQSGKCPPPVAQRRAGGLRICPSLPFTPRSYSADPVAETVMPPPRPNGQDSSCRRSLR
jgi:hypothetical protein